MRHATKRLLALVLAAAMILSLVPAAARAEENENLALGKNVTVSSYEDGTNFDGSKIVDGDRDKQSRWGTAENAAVGEWAEIDLGAAAAVKQIDIYFERSDAEQNILSFQVELYANGAYTTVFTKNERAKHHEVIELAEAQQAEKVKITVLDADGGSLNWLNVGISEVEVYGAIHEEEPVVSDNLALNRPATCSDVESGTSFTADKAVDGSTTTRWATNTGVVNPWIEIDLDDGSVLKQFNIMFERSGANQNILDFYIEVENNGAWETIFDYEGDRPAQRLKIVLPEAVTADKMKLTVTQYDGGTSNWASVSIWEIEAYSAEFKSLADVATELDALAGTIVEGDKLELPAYPGVTVEMNGADFEEVIGKDLTVHKPLTDKTVNVSFKVSDDSNSTLTADIPVIVKGLYEQAEGMNAKPTVIPEIQEWYSDSTAKLAIADVTKVTYDNAALEKVVAEFINDYKAFTGITLIPVQGEAQEGAFNFSLTAPDAKLGDEGYTMEILSDRINVASVSTTGNMYGMQTILQMVKLDAEGFAIGQMRDYPRFPVRGLLLDMARKPIAMTMVGYIARTMRYYKMNDLQLHLNDNYIWLEEYGTHADEDNGFNAYEAFRLESSLTNDAGEDPTAEDYFVTKDEMRTFIQSQRVMGMNIVPEIDVPAHAMSFTRVWPELSIDNYVHSNGHTLIDHFDLRTPAAIAKIKEIFDDYTKGENPTFDADTIVHIGADEFYLSGKVYREFVNEFVPYIKETNTLRMWGSLTAMNDNNQTKIVPEAIENVQMNLWSAGWANFQDMFDMGYQLINTIDTYGYMVPNGNGNKGAYGDYLNLDSVFNSFKPNQVGGITLPASDDQILGAAFAIWNDNIDRKSSGLTESDIFARFFNALPLYAEKNWAATGQEKGSASAITKLADKIGIAPNTNPYFDIEAQGATRASYDFQSMADASGNGFDLIAGTATVEGGVLTLNGGNSYVGTPIKKVGNLNSLSFDITLTEEAQPGTILFETTPEYYTHDIRIMADGTLGFTRELHDYSFGYRLPVGERVSVKIVSEQQVTSLYVDGELVGTATGSFTHNGEVKKTGIRHATFALPLERIGSETNAIKATIENVRLDKVIVKDYSDDSRDIPVEVLTTTAGDWQKGYEHTGEGPAEFVLDGDPSTLWHTDWYGKNRDNHWIQFELSEDYVVDGLRYLPRSGSNNGVITKYEIQISNDGENFETIKTGSWAVNKNWKAAEFEGIQAKYIRLVSIDSVSDNSSVFASAAEIRLTGTKGGEAPHEHSYTSVVTAPTCTEAGYTTYTCACGESYVADETPALGHDYVDGVCTRCGDQQETPAVNPFEDVPEESWYTDAVLWAVEKGITSGTTDTTFSPNMNVTRAQAVTFLWAAAGKPEPKTTENPFVDVVETDYFYKAVLWASENGYTSGVDATHFGPGQICTREQVVTFLWAAAGRPESSASVNFSDVPAGAWYYAPVAWAVENKITSGMGNGTFGVGQTCTRAQVVTFLYAAK